MKELIKQALDEAMKKVEKQVPNTKKETKSISIIDVSPLELPRFMKDNNIPDSACFNGRDNGYDGWDDIVLSWDIIVPTTDEDKMNFIIKTFNNNVSWNYVYRALINNDYKRVGFNTGLLRAFNDTTVYDMYISEDFVRLEKYYSLYFKKILWKQV